MVKENEPVDNDGASDIDDELPLDYEMCGTCGYDHDYDWPMLSTAALKLAMWAHTEAGDYPFSVRPV